MTNLIPPRASDAGPDDRTPEKAPDYYDLLDYAEEKLTEAKSWRSEKSCPTAQRFARVALLEEAIGLLREAMEVVR